MAARQFTFEMLADSSKFEGGMKSASRAAEAGAEKIEDAAKKADRMGSALNNAGEKADASESKFIGLADVAGGLGDLLGIEALGPIASTGLALGDLTGGFAQLAPVMTGAIDKIKNLSVVTKLQTAAQGALNFIMEMNPIFLVVAAVVALIAIFVIAYMKIGWFRDLVDTAFTTIKNVIVGAFDWVKDHWPLLLAILTGPIGLAVLAITTHWDTIKNGFTKVKEWIGEKIEAIVGFFTGIPDRITRLTSGMWDGIKDAFRAAVNFIINGWNRMEFKIPGFKVGPVGFEGFTLGLPDIPPLAGGGRAFGGRPYLVGELGPELFVPGATGTVIPGGAGGGSSLVVNAYSLDPATAATTVVRAIDEYESRNGARYARV